MYLPWLVWVMCWSLFCCPQLYVLSSFAIILTIVRELVALFFIVFRMSCYFKRSVTLPNGAVGSLQCVILVFSDHTHLLFGAVILSL